jgi:hypothetical protein
MNPHVLINRQSEDINFSFRRDLGRVSAVEFTGSRFFCGRV